MASRRLLLKAARLLAREAKALLESCQLGGKDWKCSECKKDARGRCAPQREHAEMVGTVKALRDAA